MFLLILLIQISACLLSFLAHFPKLVTYGADVFKEIDDNGNVLYPETKTTKFMYGIWMKCEENELDTCDRIKDGDKVLDLVHKDAYEELNVARVTLLVANVLAILAVVTGVWNTIHQTRISTAFHLMVSFWQLSCCAVSVSLVTHILRDASPSLNIGWVLICFWVAVGLMFLVMLLSILSTCCEVTYGDYDNDGGDKYKLEQVF